MRRTYPPQRLVRSPLIHVLAQIRYSPVLTISESIPAIQSKLKGLGFPRFTKTQVSQLTIEDGRPSVEHTDRWDFLDRDKRSGIVLTRDFVVFQTSSYLTFDRFSEVLAETLSILVGSVEIAIAERIGLRYVDLIRLDQEEAFSDYLNPALAGFPFDTLRELRIADSTFRSESIAVTELGHLAIRCMHLEGGAFLPPDLQPTVLDYAVKLRPAEEVVALDFDHFTVRPFDFRVDQLTGAVGELHDAVDLAFRRSVTEHAMAKWGQEPI